MISSHIHIMISCELLVKLTLAIRLPDSDAVKALQAAAAAQEYSKIGKRRYLPINHMDHMM